MTHTTDAIEPDSQASSVTGIPEPQPEIRTTAGIVVRDYTSNRILILALVVFSMFAFANSLSGDYIYDDLPQIVANQSKELWSLSTYTKLFTHDHWALLRSDQAIEQVDSIYYRPVFGLFLMIGNEVTGKNAILWHLIVVLLHAASVIMVFLVLEKSLAMSSSMADGNRRLAAALAAGVYAAHPVQSESVAWISGLVNPLSALFALGAFYCYLIYRDRSRLIYLAAAAGLFALAMLTKENAVTLVLIVAAYELFIHSDEGNSMARARAGFLRIIPFVAVTAGYFVARHNVLGVWFGRNKNLNFADDASLTVTDTLRTLPSLIVSYTKLAVFPFDLSLMYDFGYVWSFEWSRFWIPLFVILAVCGALVYMSRRVSETKLAIIWMIFPFLPHLNLRVFANEELIHDRYLYLSMMGFGLLIALIISRVGRLSRFRIPDRGLIVASATILLVLCISTILQNRNWQNHEATWSNAVRHAPNSRVVHMWLGWLAESKKDIDTAAREYEAALRIAPDTIDALNNSAFIYMQQRRVADATRNFERIVALTPQKAIAHFNLSFAYAAQRRYTDAARSQRRALELDPEGKRSEEWRARLAQLEREIGASIRAESAAR